MAGYKIKRLSKTKMNFLETRNRLRKELGKQPIMIEVKRCTFCNGLFESIGSKTCGCDKKLFKR